LRINWNYIKAFVLLILVVFLHAFSAGRNAERKLTDIKVNFLGDENLYITEKAVNKLLIQNDAALTSVPKEALDLNELELALNSNAMIKSAEVHLTVNGEVKADIEQRNPIARVYADASYYIDSEGLVMPLSTNHTARVPLVTGNIDEHQLENVFIVASKINKDDFLKKHIVQIHQDAKGNIVLSARTLGFKIHLGDLKSLDKKINNFKAFYQQASKDKVLDKYSKVNLQFVNQVVCTKK
jgi:cell division protein FtsQ